MALVGQPQTTVHRYGAVITTVDPTQGIVDGVLKSGSAIRISVYTTGTAFRWPVVGEAWMVRQENSNWYLEGLWPDASFKAVAPGDAIINSPTGVVHVKGSKDGAHDFTISENVTLQTFVIASRPAASSVPAGTLIFVPDGGAGAMFQGSTGSAWVNLG